jgi:hypothetical protein
MSEAACAAACSLHVNATAYDYAASCEGKGGRCRVFGLGGQRDTLEGGACEDGWVWEQGESGAVVSASEQQQSICVAKRK